ncbi:hypothetical protein [Aneurinibacillus terranovensis]|uniref:hypothetical protein n=1 Tax=Aneurinibacillus terranovensis TaxID=278991 RepID=UPI00040E1AF0|nr:hypothetical protein [Aneurinibacillus terranovensis]
MEMSQGTPIFSGEINVNSQDYILTEVKSIATQSIISKQRLKSLHDYLLRRKGDESVIIAINDQIPLLLNGQEVGQLLDELNQIIKRF